MFENFSFDGPAVARRADSPAYSPTERCSSWDSPAPRPAHIVSDARKYSLASSLSEIGLEPSSDKSSTSSNHRLAKPSPARRAHSTTSTCRRSTQTDIRLQRIFLTQMQCLAGSALVDFSVRRFGDGNGSDDGLTSKDKPRKFSASHARVEKNSISQVGCGKRRKAIIGVRGKWSLNDAAGLETQAQ